MGSMEDLGSARSGDVANLRIVDQSSDVLGFNCSYVDPLGLNGSPVFCFFMYTFASPEKTNEYLCICFQNPPKNLFLKNILYKSAFWLSHVYVVLPDSS